MDLLAPVYCAPCQNGRHRHCLGWDSGFCGCARGLCELRLETGLMWDLDDQPNGKHEGDL